jgi:hypothetical protein
MVTYTELAQEIDNLSEEEQREFLKSLDKLRSWKVFKKHFDQAGLGLVHGIFRFKVTGQFSIE